LACEHGVEGIVSKRTNGRYEPDRRTWLKTKCLNREEFVIVGWSDPEGSRHRTGALLLGYYTPQGSLIYAGRAGTGIPTPNWSAFGTDSSPWLLTRCRWPSRHREAAGSDHRSCLAACIGCGLKWSSKSAMSNGRLTVCSGMSCTWVSATISWPSTCAGNRPHAGEI
jgi:hypothetical protein